MQSLQETKNRLAAGLLALWGAMGAAQADPSFPIVDSQVREAAGGWLVAYRPISQAPVRVRHQNALLASDCVAIEVRPMVGHGREPVLRNRCTHPIALSYCIDDDATDAHACRAVGHRRVETRRIEPGAALDLPMDVLARRDVNWVACRAEAAAVSLVEGGMYGECLGDAGGPGVAATPVAVTDGE
jgi:hypothetical protein